MSRSLSLFISSFATASQQILLRVVLVSCVMLLSSTSLAVAQETEADETLSTDELAVVKAFEKRRVSAINQVIGSVVAIYDDDRQGGGSGVIIHPSGIALTNHHVIIGAGIKGWGDWLTANSIAGN